MKIKLRLVTAALVAFMAGASVASAANLVQNGSFNSVSPGSTVSGDIVNGGYAELRNNSGYLTGWTVIGTQANDYAQVWYYAAGNPDTTPSSGSWISGWAAYGPANGHNNGLTTSPDGGAMIEMDGAKDYEAEIAQTLTGLTVGQSYDVSFDFAAGQQKCCLGPTTEQLQVGFGSSTQSTPVLSVPEYAFSPWNVYNFVFTASGTSQVLSFLAIGTPNGMPPIAFLDGVSVAAVPEPASWAMMLVGFGALGVLARRRRAQLALTITA
jgi:hypothetical protein